MASIISNPSEAIPTLRSMWEFAYVYTFLNEFRNVLQLPNFQREDLERAMTVHTNDSPLMRDIFIKLLRSLSRKKASQVTAETWENILKTVINQHESEYWIDNPLHNTNYNLLKLKKRVKILKSLCDWALEGSRDIINALDHQPIEKMYIQPLGQDSKGNTYWYLNDYRLYRESKIPDSSIKDQKEVRKIMKIMRRRLVMLNKMKIEESRKKDESISSVVSKPNDTLPAIEPKFDHTIATEQTKANMKQEIQFSTENDEFLDEDDISEDENEVNQSNLNIWEIVCSTWSEFQEFVESIKKSSHPNDKALYETLVHNLLPSIQQKLQAKEKFQQRVGRRFIIHRKRTNRLQVTGVNTQNEQQKVNPQHKVNTTEEDPLHSQQKKENVVVKNTEQFQQSQSHLPHKEISDKEEKSQNASEDQSDESKSEQQQTAPTRQNPESMKKRAARQTTTRSFVREGRSSRGRKIKYRLYYQDEYFSDELVIRLPRQLCEEVVLEQESKTSGTDKAKVQTKLPPKSKQSKRKREDFEEASYEEEEEEELSDSDDEYIDEDDDDDDYVDSDSPVVSRRSSKGKSSRNVAPRLSRTQTTPATHRTQTHSQPAFLNRPQQLTPQHQRLLIQQQQQQQQQQQRPQLSQQQYMLQQQQQYASPYLSSQMIRGGIPTTPSSLNIPMSQTPVGMTSAQTRTPTTTAGGLTYLRTATSASPLTGYDTTSATTAGYTAAYGYASQTSGMTAANVASRGSNMNIRSLLNTGQQATGNPTLTMLNPQANLMSASPYSAYSTAFTSSYTPVTSQSSYSLGGALPTSYAYTNTPYNYATTTTAYGNMDRLGALTQQQATPSATGLIGTPTLSASTNPMNINRVIEGATSSDSPYGTGIGMEGITKDGIDQKQRPPPGSSGGTNNGGGSSNNNNNSSTTADVDSFINF